MINAPGIPLPGSQVGPCLMVALWAPNSSSAKSPFGNDQGALLGSSGVGHINHFPGTDWCCFWGCLGWLAHGSRKPLFLDRSGTCE